IDNATSSAAVDTGSRSFDDFGLTDAVNIERFDAGGTVGFGYGDIIYINFNIAHAEGRPNAVASDGNAGFGQGALIHSYPRNTVEGGLKGYAVSASYLLTGNECDGPGCFLIGFVAVVGRNPDFVQGDRAGF